MTDNNEPEGGIPNGDGLEEHPGLADVADVGRRIGKVEEALKDRFRRFGFKDERSLQVVVAGYLLWDERVSFPPEARLDDIDGIALSAIGWAHREGYEQALRMFAVSGLLPGHPDAPKPPKHDTGIRYDTDLSELQEPDDPADNERPPETEDEARRSGNIFPDLPNRPAGTDPE